MLTFVQFISETQDAHGYEFHVLPNYPEGHHTVVATHPTSEHSYTEHQLPPTMRRLLPKDLRNHVVGDAAIYHSAVETNDHYHQAHQVHNVGVHPEHRRKGVASAMYDHYKKHTGYDVLPSSSQSSDAQELWRSRR